MIMMGVLKKRGLVGGGGGGGLGKDREVVEWV